jgi:hypothetical protein
VYDVLVGADENYVSEVVGYEQEWMPQVFPSSFTLNNPDFGRVNKLFNVRYVVEYKVAVVLLDKSTLHYLFLEFVQQHFCDNSDVLLFAEYSQVGVIVDVVDVVFVIHELLVIIEVDVELVVQSIKL